jgi:hypothetical protein
VLGIAQEIVSLGGLVGEGGVLYTGQRPINFATMQTSSKKHRSRISASVPMALKKRLRRASAAQSRSMSAVVEELLEDNLPGDDGLKVGPGKGKAWVKANLGLLKGKFSKEDFERDDILGYLLRKHAL